MIPAPVTSNSDTDEQDNGMDNGCLNSKPFGIVQDLLFPRKVIRHIDPTKRHVMSHINLRRRRKGRHHSIVDEDVNSKDRSVEDEMEDSDLGINELLVAEFKLMNDQMRKEIRSLYRLLFFFVVLVISMAVGGILFCGDFFGNINDFHHALFEPERIRSQKWKNWYQNVSYTLMNVKGVADYVDTQYKKWNPIVQGSLQFDGAADVDTLLLGDQPSFVIPGIKAVSSFPTRDEVMLDISTCNACIFQIDPDGASIKNLWNTLEGIKNEQIPTFDVHDIFSQSMVQTFMDMLNAISKKTIWGHVVPYRVKALFGIGDAVKKIDLDNKFTNLIQTIINVISSNTRCQSGWQLAEQMKMVTSFLMDIPLGKLLQRKHIETIIKAKPVIEFPFKNLMCGDSVGISAFEDWLSKSVNGNKDILFIPIDIDKVKGSREDIKLDFDRYVSEGTMVIFGISTNIDSIHQMTEFANLETATSLGLIIRDDYELRSPITLRMQDRTVNITVQNVPNQEYPGAKRYSAKHRHLILQDVQMLSQDQYAKELVHLVSHNIGGMMLKILQVLAMREDVIPSQFIRDAFQKAQDSNPHRSREAALAVLRNEFGEERFAQFHRDYHLSSPLKAGTVGQIHFAEPKGEGGGDTRIVKIVFHEEQSMIWKNQWELLELIGSSHVIPTLHQMWNTIDVLKDNLFGEMNFEFESKYTKMAHAILIGDDRERIKEVHEEMKGIIKSIDEFTVEDSFLPCDVVQIDDDYSTSHVMMQHMAKGQNLKDWLDKPSTTLEQKQKVFRSVILWWGYLAMKHGLVHSDPHPGNIMVYNVNGDPDSITFIDWGQTDTFIKGQDDEQDLDWFKIFKKLLTKMSAIYDPNQREFAANVERLIQNLNKEFNEDGNGLLKLVGKVLLEPIDSRSTFLKAFMSDLAGVMQELGFQSEHNSPTLLAGLALGAFNNDKRFKGADKTQEAVAADPLKVFPKNAALLFRAVTGLAGMLDDQHSKMNKSELLTNDLTLVQMIMPFVN